jgi:hypothetical protein
MFLGKMRIYRAKEKPTQALSCDRRKKKIKRRQFRCVVS